MKCWMYFAEHTLYDHKTNKEIKHNKFRVMQTNLTFIGLCIANIFAENSQQDAMFLNLFISVRCSTCFRRFFSVHRQELKTARTVPGICQTVTATCR
jgi:hypothetical protein